jgi:hypothetical protein
MTDRAIMMLCLICFQLALAIISWRDARFSGFCLGAAFAGLVQMIFTFSPMDFGL